MSVLHILTDLIDRENRFWNGKPVFTANIEPAVAANPYLSFFAKVDESGTFKFSWTDDDGTVTTAEEKITVS